MRENASPPLKNRFGVEIWLLKSLHHHGSGLQKPIDENNNMAPEQTAISGGSGVAGARRETAFLAAEP